MNALVRMMVLAWATILGCKNAPPPAAAHAHPVPVDSATPADAALLVDAAPPADPARPVDAGVDATELDCAEPCTEYGVCWEKVHKRDYRGGSNCVYECEKMSPDDQRAWAKAVNRAFTSGKCRAIVEVD